MLRYITILYYTTLQYTTLYYKLYFIHSIINLRVSVWEQRTFTSPIEQNIAELIYIKRFQAISDQQAQWVFNTLELLTLIDNVLAIWITRNLHNLPVFFLLSPPNPNLNPKRV